MAIYVVQGNTRTSAVRRARSQLRTERGPDLARRAVAIDVQHRKAP